MTNITTFTLTGQAEIRQRLNSQGLGSLGLGSPLLSRVWTQSLPAVDEANLRLTPAEVWYAPMAGTLSNVTDPQWLGLCDVHGTPVPSGQHALFVFHPQARLRLEHFLVAALQPAGLTPADQTLVAVPSMILIRSLAAPLDGPLLLQAGELTLPAGLLSFHDERGLLVDPFAFASALDALAGVTPALFQPLPGTPAAGTLGAIAGTVGAGVFLLLSDLHGRPWRDPGVGRGVAVYAGPPGNRGAGTRVTDGTLTVWPSGAILASEADPDGTVSPPPPQAARFGWASSGRLGTPALTQPPAGAGTPLRVTYRVCAADLDFHLLGNRSASERDGVPRADDHTVAEPAPLVRDGSPVTLLPTGRATLGWFGQAMLALQGGNPLGPFTSGPLLAVSPALDDGRWTLPRDPTPAGEWPFTPPAPVVATPERTVLAALGALRSGCAARWITGSNDVLVTLPAGLPDDVSVRLYPIEVRLGDSPSAGSLLRRHDGQGTIVAGGTGQILLSDPLRLGRVAVNPRPAGRLRADAAVTWLAPTGVITHVIGSLKAEILGDGAPPALPAANLLAQNFWKGIATAPILDILPRGSFALAAPSGNPLAYLGGLVRQLATDQNPREAPRLPSMARTESLLAVQLPGAPADAYRAVLSGGWLTRDTDASHPEWGNPGGAARPDTHAPGIAATSQLGFDLWVAALHRARPVVPTADIATLPGVPNNWVTLQASAAMVPPGPPAAPSSWAGTALQTVPALVETPELAFIPSDDVPAVEAFVTAQLGNWISTPNDPELHRQLVREVHAAKGGRRDAQWALRRAFSHARELVYVETSLLGATAHDEGAPPDALQATDLIAVLAGRLSAEPGLRVILLTPREIPFAAGFAPWASAFYRQRKAAVDALVAASATVPGPSRVLAAHPIGFPGRPKVLRGTTVIVDDTWLLSGTSTLSRRGLSFDGASDVVLADLSLDRGSGTGIRAHRLALMAAHLRPHPADLPRLQQPRRAFDLCSEMLADGGRGALLPLWEGPAPAMPGFVPPHPIDVADPDGGGGTAFIVALMAALAGNGEV